jgi:hypothetical protein
MATMKQLKAALTCVLFTLLPNECFGEIMVGKFTKTQAKELGIVMKHRSNGDAGIKVWLEFRKEGVLEGFTYCELRMTDEEGKHQVSTRIQPHPVIHGQPKELLSVAFSADQSKLEHCSFLIVSYGKGFGGVGHQLQVKDFIDLEK